MTRQRMWPTAGLNPLLPRWRGRIAFGIVSVMLLIAPAAGAFQWHHITREASDIGLARTGDGVLHVLWAGPARIPYTSVFDTTITPAGKLRSPQSVLSGWSAVNAPDAVVTPDGRVHVLVGGAKTGALGDATAGINDIVGPESWTFPAAAFGNAPGASSAGNAEPRAAVLPGGQIVSVWQTGLDDFAQTGTDPVASPQSIRVDATFASPDVAVDRATGQAVAIFNDHNAYTYRTVAPTLGPPVRIDNPPFPGELPALSARIGGGLFTTLIAPSFDRVKLLWLGHGSRALPVGRGTKVVSAGTTPGPGGRMWVFWGNEQTTYVTRTNRAATAFEPVRSFPNPPHVAQLFKIQGEGSQGPLDLFAGLTIDGAQLDGVYQAHFLPRLTLTVAGRIGDTRFGRLRARVTDAGDPVAGATVTTPLGPRTTNAHGLAYFSGRFTTPFTVTADKPGYVSAKQKIAK